jgi:hypothetical protein
MRPCLNCEREDMINDVIAWKIEQPAFGLHWSYIGFALLARLLDCMAHETFDGSEIHNSMCIEEDLTLPLPSASFTLPLAFSHFLDLGSFSICLLDAFPNFFYLTATCVDLCAFPLLVTISSSTLQLLNPPSFAPFPSRLTHLIEWLPWVGPRAFLIRLLIPRFPSTPTVLASYLTHRNLLNSSPNYEPLSILQLTSFPIRYYHKYYRLHVLRLARAGFRTPLDKRV